ncbi:hypothetical protein NKH18_35530 [Streptomyces sp. M10(2022)]
MGSLVVQLAVDAGAHVTAVDAPQHADRLRGYGADRVVGPSTSPRDRPLWVVRSRLW